MKLLNKFLRKYFLVHPFETPAVLLSALTDPDAANIAMTDGFLLFDTPDGVEFVNIDNICTVGRLERLGAVVTKIVMTSGQTFICDNADFSAQMSSSIFLNINTKRRVLETLIVGRE